MTISTCPVPNDVSNGHYTGAAHLADNTGTNDALRMFGIRDGDDFVFTIKFFKQ